MRRRKEKRFEQQEEEFWDISKDFLSKKSPKIVPKSPRMLHGSLIFIAMAFSSSIVIDIKPPNSPKKNC